jgi:hypothetical protein
MQSRELGGAHAPITYRACTAARIYVLALELRSPDLGATKYGVCSDISRLTLCLDLAVVHVALALSDPRKSEARRLSKPYASKLTLGQTYLSMNAPCMRLTTELLVLGRAINAYRLVCLEWKPPYLLEACVV